MPSPIADGNKMIELAGVSRTYGAGPGAIHALRDVHLSVAAGETVALTGASGSGKSTLLHLMGGLEWPTAGTITVAGQPLHGLSDEALTRFRLTTVGFVFQFFHLLPALTVLENLLLPPELAGMAAGPAREKAREGLAAVGLAGRERAFPDQLSGGEQQRVAVARALMLDPPLLLADEPTGNLDSTTGGHVMDVLLRLSSARGATLLMATHSEALARHAARRIELLDGRIIADHAVPDADRARP